MIDIPPVCGSFHLASIKKHSDYQIHDLTNAMTCYCKYCGSKYPSVSTLTSTSCHRHPSGPNKGKHALYESSEKSRYTCKNCGREYPSLSTLTASSCHRHPDGANKGKHEPAL